MTKSRVEQHEHNNYSKMGKTYFDRLNEARQYAKGRIIKELPWVLELRKYINCYFTKTTDVFTGIEIADENFQYKTLLLLSFMRTHYVLYELIFLSSNIEAAVLARKQIELLCRIKELCKYDAHQLNKKTPNISNFKLFGKEYGILSTIAHSASLDCLDSLGFTKIDDEHKKYFAQPTYTENTTDLMESFVVLFIEFILISLNIKDQIIPRYDSTWDLSFLVRFFTFGKENGISCLKGLDLNKLNEPFE